ncbi:DUF2834 domain-containing protein [Sulfurimonas sp.]|uniref:DUF2834 domain-containing protein n=1 Tax=Sulfurimonas sp. TaxID=2022749 RepID=UPI003568D368
MKKIYLLLAILGFILPLSQFISWLFDYGIDVPLMFRSVAEDKLSLFAWLDVIVSALVLIVFIVYEGKKKSMPRLWVPIAGTLCVGVSFGLPLFLLLREMHLEKNA